MQNDLVCAAVLSGNRNFEARIHPNLRANFLASPPLVVAYAIAGTVLMDLMTEPLGKGKDGKDVYLGDIWPTSEEIYDCLQVRDGPEGLPASSTATSPSDPLWKQVPSARGPGLRLAKSTYIAEPPFFEDFACSRAAHGAIRARACWASSATRSPPTTSSPAGSIKDTSPAGKYLIEQRRVKADFNSYGARRGNHEVMMRGTFANVRIKNLMLPPKADGAASRAASPVSQPGGEQMTIYDAAMKYIAEGMPTVIFAGEEYGTGSSRDWAAKGPSCWASRRWSRAASSASTARTWSAWACCRCSSWATTRRQTLGINGNEQIDVVGLDDDLRPQQDAHARDPPQGRHGRRGEGAAAHRHPIEVDY